MNDVNANDARSVNQQLSNRWPGLNAKPVRVRVAMSRAASQRRKLSSGGNKTATSNIVHCATSTPSSNRGSGPRWMGHGRSDF